jgi:crotonobetainyl-CoA:carnitine CoA-transferase CaiB-like acyl-CoA transferase
MAEITRPGPLAGVRLIDVATVVMGPCAAQIFGDLRADVIKLEAPHDTLRGRECKSMSKLPLGELSEDRQVQEQLIEAIEKTYGSDSYAEPSEERA